MTRSGDPLVHRSTTPTSRPFLWQELFPLREQIDRSMARTYGALRGYAARRSLMAAPHSTPENSDIQILPAGADHGKSHEHRGKCMGNP